MNVQVHVVKKKSLPDLPEDLGASSGLPAAISFDSLSNEESWLTSFYEQKSPGADYIILFNQKIVVTPSASYHYSLLGSKYFNTFVGISKLIIS